MSFHRGACQIVSRARPTYVFRSGIDENSSDATEDDKKLSSWYARVKERYDFAGQGHVLENYWSSPASPVDRRRFLRQLDQIEVESLETCLREASNNSFVKEKGNDDDEYDEETIEPYDGEVGFANEEDVRVGLEAVRAGRVAVVVLAGGQGTQSRIRWSLSSIGSSCSPPKKTTTTVTTPYRLLAERIVALQRFSGEGSIVPLRFMTSRDESFVVDKDYGDDNHGRTVAYFASHDNFGLSDVGFFPQGTLPCLQDDIDNDDDDDEKNRQGQILMRVPMEVATAPDGNGGLYAAMKRHGVLNDFQQKGIHYVHVVAVDNVLGKPADPAFVGRCVRTGADCASKVVARQRPDEKVGVFAIRCKRTADGRSRGHPCVVEYSELDDERRQAVVETTTTESGKPKTVLLYGSGNICNHMFHINFLQRVTQGLDQAVKFHVARKRVPCYRNHATTTTAGIKLERFIFDPFPVFANLCCLMEVDRDEEFGPIKNAPGSASDGPEQARALLSRRAKRWLVAAGAVLTGADNDDDDEKFPCHISPLTSYGGEGLENYNGKQVHCPFSI